MSQQINLINPALIKKKDFFTTANISLVYAAFGLMLLVWYGYLYQQTKPLLTQRDQVDTQLTAVQNRLTEMQLARQPQDNAALELQVKTLLKQKEQQAQLIKRITQSGANTKHGVSQYMRGLARQTMQHVWLTGFDIDSEHHALSLTGRTLNADVLPKFIQKLGSEMVFAGQAFGGLQVRTPTTNQLANKAEITEAESEEEAAPYVEFELRALEVEGAKQKALKG